VGTTTSQRGSSSRRASSQAAARSRNGPSQPRNTRSVIGLEHRRGGRPVEMKISISFVGLKTKPAFFRLSPMPRHP
jgi:hypothetical protein